MSYRPICDIWFLARAKLKSGKKYYGAYLGGFPERARVLLGAGPDDAVLHVCGGMAPFYPYKGGFGRLDKTLDIDPAVDPDFLQDAREPFPDWTSGQPREDKWINGTHWTAILMDPPYSEVDAAHYNCGASVYPKPNQLINNALDVLPVGGRVGLIHYCLPAQPKNAKFVAAVGILCGFNNRIRVFSVFQKIA